MLITQLAPLQPASEVVLAREQRVERTRHYARKARSDRTKEAYRAELKAFEAFCRACGEQPLPAAPDTVAQYLSSRADAGRKVATISLALTAISQAHQVAGFESPRNAPEVAEVWKGICNDKGEAPTRKAPLTAANLRTMVAALPQTLAGTRDRALLLVGFAGAFRRSELVALERADLTFTEEGLTVLLRRSKTDQEGKGHTVGLPYGSAAATCPVRATQAWLERAGIAEGRVFRAVGRYDQLGGPLQGRAVARIVKRSVQAFGLDASDFSGHSLRAGLATSAAKAGKPAHVIMKTTGHRSVAMVQRYIRDAELFTDNAAAGLL